MTFDLNLYKVFFVVAQCKNISRASELLFVSQPAVSKSIKTLENSIKLTLFSRNSKGVNLTPEGEILFTHIEKAFKQIDLGENILEKLKNKEIGNINLGVSTTVGKSYFLPKFRNFSKEYSHFKINIINKPTLDTINLIKEDKLDLGIIASCKNEIPNEADLQFIKLCQMQDIFVANNTYLKKLNYKSIDDIFSRGSFMLLEKPNATREHIDEYFNKQNLKITPYIEASNMDFLIECAKTGLGITSIIEDFSLTDLEKGSLIEIPLDKKIPPRYIGIIYKNSTSLSIAAKTLIDFLKNEHAINMQ
ncbi:LysR family transcriptional regulator [Clostridium saccharobutylicum]|uniref:HTH-type transcriptional regulator YybE n=1 Tax=Clostridium saccharobutylicum DSM 13864 TaxID=1345695 RepID=U5MVV7_CLOSA|nr:LysR family transcriptional regulator [Clostridium saccharobutylicum]AGX43577.1 HTH-type transcriptional regulator YybE [Clostridium saccharobutylicum DSM 13864]AQR90875.1 HTH-type transcriptional regulator CynR [Clostridium saccharobutylicum]AQS00779.1 HTH-type transcriptional regulator CynR [Clostridium saccharobutylicum]AQS10441.1 HTH-type transcriptional regulator CynR [Clostridium saccharobutylicum]AQS14762.1 HTH-type transcriptional regulator CynR [Clostridium saccharobutylicum]